MPINNTPDESENVKVIDGALKFKKWSGVSPQPDETNIAEDEALLFLREESSGDYRLTVKDSNGNEEGIQEMPYAHYGYGGGQFPASSAHFDTGDYDKGFVNFNILNTVVDDTNFEKNTSLSKFTYKGNRDILIHVSLVASCETAVPNTDCRFLIYKNGAQLLETQTVEYMPSGERAQVSIQVPLSLSQDDDIEFYSYAEGSTNEQFTTQYCKVTFQGVRYL